MERPPARTAAPLPPPLSVDLQIDRDGAVLATVRGQVDRAAVPEIAARLRSADAGGELRDTILDLGGVEFIDSGGLHLLLQEHQRLGSRDAALVLIAPAEPVRGLLSLTGLDRYLTVVDTLPQARGLLQQGGPGEGRPPAP